MRNKTKLCIVLYKYIILLSHYTNLEPSLYRCSKMVYHWFAIPIHLLLHQDRPTKILREKWYYYILDHSVGFVHVLKFNKIVEASGMSDHKRKTSRGKNDCVPLYKHAKDNNRAPTYFSHFLE